MAFLQRNDYTPANKKSSDIADKQKEKPSKPTSSFVEAAKGVSTKKQYSPVSDQQKKDIAQQSVGGSGKSSSRGSSPQNKQPLNLIDTSQASFATEQVQVQQRQLSLSELRQEYAKQEYVSFVKNKGNEYAVVKDSMGRIVWQKQIGKDGEVYNPVDSMTGKSKYDYSVTQITKTPIEQKNQETIFDIAKRIEQQEKSGKRYTPMLRVQDIETERKAQQIVEYAQMGQLRAEDIIPKGTELPLTAENMYAVKSLAELNQQASPRVRESLRPATAQESALIKRTALIERFDADGMYRGTAKAAAIYGSTYAGGAALAFGPQVVGGTLLRFSPSLVKTLGMPAIKSATEATEVAILTKQAGEQRDFFESIGVDKQVATLGAAGIGIASKYGLDELAAKINKNIMKGAREEVTQKSAKVISDEITGSVQTVSVTKEGVERLVSQPKLTVNIATEEKLLYKDLTGKKITASLITDIEAKSTERSVINTMIDVKTGVGKTSGNVEYEKYVDSVFVPSKQVIRRADEESFIKTFERQTGITQKELKAVQKGTYDAYTIRGDVKTTQQMFLKGTLKQEGSVSKELTKVVSREFIPSSDKILETKGTYKTISKSKPGDINVEIEVTNEQGITTRILGTDEELGAVPTKSFSLTKGDNLQSGIVSKQPLAKFVIDDEKTVKITEAQITKSYSQFQKQIKEPKFTISKVKPNFVNKPMKPFTRSTDLMKVEQPIVPSKFNDEQFAEQVYEQATKREPQVISGAIESLSASTGKLIPQTNLARIKSPKIASGIGATGILAERELAFQSMFVRDRMKDAFNSQTQPIRTKSMDVEFKSTVDMNIAESLRTNQRDIQIPSTRDLTRPLTDVSVKSIPSFKIDTRLVVRPITDITDIGRTSIATGLIPPLIDMSFNLPSLKAKRETGYNVYVREKGKLIKVNQAPQSEDAAKSLLAEFVDNTASATGVVKPTKAQAQERESYYGFFANKYTQKKRNTYIEKNAYRIDTRGELEGITVKGWQARRMNAKSILS